MTHMIGYSESLGLSESLSHTPTSNPRTFISNGVMVYRQMDARHTQVHRKCSILWSGCTLGNQAAHEVDDLKRSLGAQGIIQITRVKPNQ